MRPTKARLIYNRDKDRGIPENLKNCRRCGKVFIAVGNERICAACLKSEQAERNRLMDYVRDNPGVTLEKAIAESGVSEKIVKGMVLEGTFANDRDQIVTQASRVCAICGRPVAGTGIYCRSCSARLQRETKKMAEQAVDPTTSKKVGELNTIDKLNAQAARELAREMVAKPIRSKM